MTVTSEGTAERIARQGRDELVHRLRFAFATQASRAGVALNDDELQRRIAAAVPRAGADLWRRSLAQAAMAELGIDLAAAVGHPDVVRAHQLVGAPPYAPPSPPPPGPPAGAARAAVAVEPGPEFETLRVPSVHIAGVESLKGGERDIELRLSAEGLDVLKRSSGVAIGRLQWREITGVELAAPRRGLRRGAQELHVNTLHGRVTFELPGITDEQLHQHLIPMLGRAGVDCDDHRRR